MRLIAPQGTPALFKSSIQWALGFSLVILPMRSFRALRFFERNGGLANSGADDSSHAPTALQNRSHKPSPEAAMLMWPSLVGNTPVGTEVGWSLPACRATSPAISQRAA